MADHQLRARYIELTIRDEDQQPDVYGPDVVLVRTQDDELLPFEKAVLQATYVSMLPPVAANDITVVD